MEGPNRDRAAELEAEVNALRAETLRIEEAARKEKQAALASTTTPEIKVPKAKKHKKHKKHKNETKGK